MNAWVRGPALAAAAMLAACGGSGADPTATARGAVLVDARNGGAPGFWFLPPVAAEPGDATPNRRGLAPIVEVVELAPGARGVVARLDAPKDAGAHYLADWDASASALAPGLTYEIRVSLSGALLGYADAQVSADGGELQFLYSLETFPLTGERTLPVKFRIAEPAPDADGDLVPDASDDCPTVPDAVQLDSDGDGLGDACECASVACPAPADACHGAGACDPATGACSTPAAPDGTACAVDGGAGACTAGVCVLPPSPPPPPPLPPPPPPPPPACDGCGCATCGCGGCACGCTGGCCGCDGGGSGGGMTMPRWP